MVVAASHGRPEWDRTFRQISLAEARSRSFRRLKNALMQILLAHEEGKAIVTPSFETDEE